MTGQVVCLDALPNDHSQLPPLGEEGGDAAAGGEGGGGKGGHVAPRTATERLVQRLLQASDTGG